MAREMAISNTLSRGDKILARSPVRSPSVGERLKFPEKVEILSGSGQRDPALE